MTPDQALQTLATDSQERGEYSSERLKFEVWLRTECFQRPPRGYYDLALCAWQARAAQADNDTARNALLLRIRKFITNECEHPSAEFWLEAQDIRDAIDAAMEPEGSKA